MLAAAANPGRVSDLQPPCQGEKETRMFRNAIHADHDDEQQGTVLEQDELDHEVQHCTLVARWRASCQCKLDSIERAPIQRVYRGSNGVGPLSNGDEIGRGRPTGGPLSLNSRRQGS